MRCTTGEPTGKPYHRAIFLGGIMNLKFTKHGLFYDCFDDDALIMNLIFGYKIRSGKLGFPEKVKNKVINVLEGKKINYFFDEETNKDFKNLNRYEKYLYKAKNILEVEYKILEIKEKMKNMNDKELDSFINYIERYFDER